MEPYTPRRVRSHGTRDANGWRLKLYSIVRDGSAPDWGVFEPAIVTAFGALPTPARAPGRPGVGFVIAHAGRDVWYTVLCWWDRENELPVRVWVAERDASGVPRWRQAQGSESICVWDLEVLWHERQAYVDTILSNPDVENAESQYLAQVIERGV